MTGPQSVFVADDYVVRYGLRGFCGALLGLLLWTALVCLIVIRTSGPSIEAALALGLGEIALLTACAIEIWRAARREIVFAVSQDGVYFGSGPLMAAQRAEAVPWQRIGAVELFTDKTQRGIRSRHRCVGVLDRAEEVRLAYRRMSGWRINASKLDVAVKQYAPSVPLIDDRSPSPVRPRPGQPENA